jgi:hypothetical protein
MDFKKVDAFKKLSLPLIYRLFLKNMKLYPSKNRFELLTAIQEEFHTNLKLTDPKKINEERIKAEMGLRHVFYYIEKNKDLMANRYHNTDEIEPFAKKREDVVYF